MQIVLGILIAALIGVVVHFTVPYRAARGILVAPLAATAAGAVVWTVLTWAGFDIDNPLLWLSVVVVPAVVSIPTALLLGRGRAQRDAAERTRLRIT